MIFVEIPGRDNLNIKNVVFDYNGTVAEDGIMSLDTKENLKKISEKLKVYIITADTYGNVKKQCEGLPVSIETFPKGNATFYKKSFVEKLGPGETMVIGNGMNDIEMFKVATFSIAVIGEEGCAGKLIVQSDIVVSSIEKVFSMIENTNRIVATLRD
ncbi:ATPase P [Clostridium botulinum]|uniref:ATPase P n=1 Tax=Clostridium botulinum TaxID=1491 RepID=A0A6G4CUL2_CLOBO|nr:ATPase P [Clostridium botulinum]NEZ98992.1 ATPase P [Clostridium botulinum]NFA32908.1 ATPase P [Clostridium botulinum]NFA86658.1 ATPase P [Clostridium botulinum]NFB06193.1 ATPase P [Clostridium botulinum]